MANLKMIYDTLWEDSIKRFKENNFEVDKFLTNRQQDYRRGLTIIGSLENKVLVKFLNFLNECTLIDPNQHYYAIDDIHITILSIITCFDGFTLDSIDEKAYAALIQEAIRHNNPLKIYFKGITASPSCIMVQGFPVDNGLSLLRENLRDNFRNSGLKNSIDKRYILETAHSTIIRFKYPVADHRRFIECLNDYRDYDFGLTHITDIELVYNDWYMSNQLVLRIKTFRLQEKDN